MALPKQIRNQIKQNEEITKAIRGASEDVQQTNRDTAQAEIDALLNEVDPKEPEKTPAQTNVTELHPNKDEGGGPESTPEANKQERTDWKQKYAVLKGKYDAEVPRLSQDLRDAKGRISKLEADLAAVVRPKEEKAPTRVDFTPEEIEDYGEDLLEVIGRKARSIVEKEYVPTIEGLRGEIKNLKTQLGETGSKVSKFETNEVIAELDRTVKDWRAINVDPDFHEWLEQIDPFSGEPKKELMLRAFNRKNAQQVKSFFEKYVQENAAVTPNNQAASIPSGQGGNPNGARLDLSDYVAPGAPRQGGNAGAPKDKRHWSSVEIGKFYSDVQKGHYKNRPADKARIEADIVAATREGRIKS